MKRTFITLTLAVTTGLTAFSQDWAPISSTAKHHFRIDTADHIIHTVYVDSISIAGTDSIFHLNRVTVECDTCENSYYHFIWKNQPQFLQRRMLRLADDIYRFEDTAVFYLRAQAGIGEFWIYDSLNSITASVDDIYYGYVLGTADSLKRILLSAGDTILLSKNYGIIRFPANEGSSYSIEGIEGDGPGLQVPAFHDFFNFEIGDVFQYKYTSGYLGDEWHSLSKITILSKSDYGDSLVYEVHNIGFNWQTTYPGYPHDTVFFAQYTLWNFTDSASHFCNRYNNESAFTSPVSWGPLYSPVELVWESDSLVCKKIRPVYGWAEGLGYRPTEPSDPLYHPDLLIMAVDGYDLEYRPGLGQVYYMLWVFEFNEWEELIGYVKDGDTTGKVYEDSILTAVPFTAPLSGTVSIYPNPARDHFYVGLPDSHDGPCHVSIFNFQGQQKSKYDFGEGITRFRVDVSSLRKGVYYILVTGREHRVVSKLIVY